jgi:hypothetical protein
VTQSLNDANKPSVNTLQPSNSNEMNVVFCVAIFCIAPTPSRFWTLNKATAASQPRYLAHACHFRHGYFPCSEHATMLHAEAEQSASCDCSDVQPHCNHQRCEQATSTQLLQRLTPELLLLLLLLLADTSAAKRAAASAACCIQLAATLMRCSFVGCLYRYAARRSS